MSDFELPFSRSRFGIARCDITPQVGIYHRMWGAASHDQSEGVHLPLTATAIVMAPTGQASRLLGYTLAPARPVAARTADVKIQPIPEYLLRREAAE